MSAQRPVSVFVGEDSSQMRDLVRAWLARDGRLELVGEADNGDDLLAGVASTRPDVLVLDLTMPRSQGLEAFAAIRGRSPDTRILVLTGTHLRWAEPARAMADAFLLKPASMPELASTIHALGRQSSASVAPSAQRVASA